MGLEERAARAQLGTQVIALKGDPAPGGGTFDGFLDRPAINNAGQVAFLTTLTGTSGGAANNTAVVRGGPGALTQIVREGQA